MATAVLQAEKIEIPDDIWEAQEYFVEKGWSDGLPVIPPTEERVAKMLTGTKRNPDEVIPWTARSRILNIVVVIAVVLWLLQAFGVLGSFSSIQVGH